MTPDVARDRGQDPEDSRPGEGPDDAAEGFPADIIDAVLSDSFPASDPPPWTLGGSLLGRPSRSGG
jgi:hypothetical protein